MDIQPTQQNIFQKASFPKATFSLSGGLPNVSNGPVTAPQPTAQPEQIAMATPTQSQPINVPQPMNIQPPVQPPIIPPAQTQQIQPSGTPLISKLFGFIGRGANAVGNMFDNSISINNSNAETQPVTPQKTVNPTTKQDTNNGYESKALNVQPRQLNKLVSLLVSEAGGEGQQGMQAVLNSIINRTKVNPNYYGNNVFNVISMPNQYTGFSVRDSNYKEVLDYLDKKKVALTPGRQEQIAQAEKLIAQAKAGQLQDITNGATHYYNPASAQHQSWMDKAEPRKDIGNHKFVYLYR